MLDKDETLKNVVDIYDSKYGLSFKKDIEGKAPCCLYDNDNLTAAICIDEWQFDSAHIGALAHEILHLIICISDACECPINMHTSECWAYAYTTFIETFLDILGKEEKDE